MKNQLPDTAEKLADLLKQQSPEFLLLTLQSVARSTKLKADPAWRTVLNLIDPPKPKRAESRSDRFSEAQGSVGDAKSQAEELRDELQGWLDNLPENLQSGSKADELQSAIDELESFISSCEEAEGVSVDFPGMMG
jgi:hypothetical protein